MTFRPLILLLSLFLINCPSHNSNNKRHQMENDQPSGTPGTPKKSPAASPAAPWSIDYGDGSGNGFLFFQRAATGPARFSYSPMTPQLSSSGSYSGGSPRQGQLDASQVQKLWSMVERLAADRSQHAATRKKGTGMFFVERPSGKRHFIVERNPGLRAFEALIKPFRGTR